MPYKTTTQLPKSTRTYLPPHAQKIFKEAFNHAWEEYKDPEKRKSKDTLEEVAFKVAWSAVKNKYQKDESSKRWVKKSNC